MYFLFEKIVFDESEHQSKGSTSQFTNVWEMRGEKVVGLYAGPPFVNPRMCMNWTEPQQQTLQQKVGKLV